jgi:anaerobic dimethyl sulfoxide reductase subunit B (iron-sulfur subunit)
MGKQRAFHVDLSGCIGCKACQIACQDKNKLEAGRTWRRVAEVVGGHWVPQGGRWLTDTFAYYVSTACMHCEKPICCEVCPTHARAKRPDGVVLIDQVKCVGCRYCEWACPYGAPQFDASSGKMTGCNFCEDLLAQGKNPACVDSCVMRVLKFGELEELRAKFGTVNAVAPLPEASLTKPSVVLTPHRHARLSGEGEGLDVTVDKRGAK